MVRYAYLITSGRWRVLAEVIKGRRRGMCGIFGYVGTRPDAPELVLAGLKKLEYRGYDSWGLAMCSHPNGGGIKHDGASLVTWRQVGKISAADSHKGGLAAALEAAGPATVALGHSRWATHGGVTEANAHPHDGCATGQLALVHNGIVENHQALKDELRARGHTFSSRTDTEVIAHLNRSPGGTRRRRALF